MSVSESALSSNQSSEFPQSELHVISPILSGIAARRTEILGRWWDAYTERFHGAQTLSHSEFNQAMGSAIDTMEEVLGGDLDDFDSKVRRRWYSLARRGLPFAEAMVMVQASEENAFSVLGPKLSNGTPTYPLLHSYAHGCIPLIAEAYMQARLAEGWDRPSSEPLLTNGAFHGLIGSSASMQRLYGLIEAVGRTASTALILGETGVGKELVARAIHECGRGADGPFVAVNCAALPGHLIESELFGHVRGSFTGADADAQGLFRAAHRGTLFLDEITEMNLSAQARLLRAIQERTVRPVGSLQEFPVDVRIIASTNRDPQEAIANRHLREDLYYRLNVAPLQVPPLRERSEDIEPLMRHFINLFNKRLARSVPVIGVSKQTTKVVVSYVWPGNVRELANAIESALTFCRSNIVRLGDLPKTIVPRPTEARTPSSELVSIAEAECELVRRALDATNGNISAAARLLGITRKRLYARIVRYDLPC